MADVAEKLTFKSEAEREKALLELPDEAPRGVNIETWQSEIETQKQAIMDAQIVAEEPAAEPTPVQAEPTDTQAADKVFHFGDIPANELPEELRGYDSAGHIIKQFGHARAFANKAEERINSMSEQLAQAQAKAEEAERLRQEIETLKAKEQVKVSSPKTTTAQKSTAQTNIDDLNAKLAVLNNMADEDFVSAKDMKETFGIMTNKLAESANVASTAVQELNNYRTTAEERIGGLESKLNTYVSTQDRIVQEQQAQQQTESAAMGIKKLQETFPELQTSKPVMGNNGNNVENDVMRFVNKIAILKNGRSATPPPGTPNPDYSEFNAILNAYNRGDPDVVAFCQNNGITPESVQTNPKDIQAYALIANADYHTRGGRIDPYSGRVETVIGENGQPVNFPSRIAAYKWMKDEYGLTQAERNEQLAEAEKRGQQNLEKSIEKRDLSVPAVTPESSGGPQNIGQEISEEEANRILETPEIEFNVELEARKGNPYWFDLYNKANRRLGLPEIPWDHSWPPRKD